MFLGIYQVSYAMMTILWDHRFLLPPPPGLLLVPPPPPVFRLDTILQILSKVIQLHYHHHLDPPVPPG